MNPAEQRLQIHVIFGPTASGKGKLAISLWEKYGYPLLSVDSRKVYRGADIGTNKLITLNFIKNNPTALVGGLDIVDPNEPMSAYIYQQHVYKWLTTNEAAIRKAGGLVLHGGTGLYFDAILQGLSLLSPADDALRAELSLLNLELLQLRAKAVNAERFSQLNDSDRQNSRRLIRVIENASLPSNDQVKTFVHPIFADAEYIKYPLTTDRESLYEGMNTRVYRYLEEGWLEEVANLRKVWGDTAPALQMMGYRQLVTFMQNNENWRELAQVNAKEFLSVIETIQQEHRRYAKRQITWGKRANQTID
jgi:tRNA dimethylallyltransferase